MEKFTNSNSSRIVEILTNSFDDNKSTNWVIKSDKKRVQRINKLIYYAMDICKLQDGIYISNDGNGALVFDFPKTSKYNLNRLLSDIKFIFGVIGIGRLFKVLKRENYIKKFHPKDNYIYLWFLGVNPEKQGRGIGSSLLEELNNLADKRKLSIYLETSNPKNLKLYQKYGFSIYHEWNADFIGFPIWFMRRENV